MGRLGVKLKEMVVTPNPNKEDDWGVRYIFTCDNCGEDHNLDIFTKEENDAFIESLKPNNHPTKNVMCIKCFPRLN